MFGLWSDSGSSLAVGPAGYNWMARGLSLDRRGGRDLWRHHEVYREALPDIFNHHHDAIGSTRRLGRMVGSVH
jgi:hypothetical protein